MHRDRRRGVQLGAQCGVGPSADPLARLERQVHGQGEEHAEEHHKGLEDLRLEGLLDATDADRLELKERLGADDAARARDEATASARVRASVRNRKVLGGVEGVLVSLKQDCGGGQGGAGLHDEHHRARGIARVLLGAAHRAIELSDAPASCLGTS